MRTPRALIGLLVLLAASLAIPGSASAAPPINDHYLGSLPLNADNTRLNRTETLKDMRDTSQATTQTNVLTPDANGRPSTSPGPGEPTTCGGSVIGRTVWYDFYPDLNGVVRLRANGFNSAITVVPFDPATSRPDFSRKQCANESASVTEEFLAKVRKNRAYTVQIGGVGGVGGMLEFLFDFIPSYPRLKADPTLLVRPTSRGVELVSLKVAATRGARVSMSCTKRACRKQTKKAGRRSVSFNSRLKGRTLRAGTTLVLRVTKKDSIGSYIAFKIRRGRFTKIERCLSPGSKKPRKCA